MKLRSLLFVLFLSGTAVAAPTKATAPKKMTTADVERAAREAIALAPPKLPKTATITAIKCAQVPDVPFTPAKVTLDVTPPPRRIGTVATTAILVFWRTATEIGARVPVSLELDVPPSALVYDVTKGSPVTLAIQHGLVEVTTPAVASGDGDVGDVVQVLLRPSGRAIRARVVAKDKVVAVEDGR